MLCFEVRGLERSQRHHLAGGAHTSLALNGRQSMRVPCTALGQACKSWTLAHCRTRACRLLAQGRHYDQVVLENLCTLA